MGKPQRYRNPSWRAFTSLENTSNHKQRSMKSRPGNYCRYPAVPPNTTGAIAGNMMPSSRSAFAVPQYQQPFSGCMDYHTQSLPLPGQYPYIPQFFPTVPSHHQMLHTSVNFKQHQYYHQQPFHLQPQPTELTLSPTAPGYPPFSSPQPSAPYYHQQVQLPSPAPSVAVTVGSTTGCSNHKGLVDSSPTLTATTMAAKATRKSPVIASTPLKTPSYEDDTFDFSSPATASGGSKCPINLHIAPLPPTMTDSQLLEMVAPFGEIISHKAILDRPSRECKGYGFAKFADHDSAQACIEALTEKNYYVTIARDSFYSKLKDLADEGSTNLYVSNLPVKWDEDKIVAIFKGYEHTKCRLLVNTDGSSKGVAFIDFKDRKICDEIIERFNGIGIAEEEPFLPLQVRYADTVAQKKLKKEKQMVGQFPKKSVLANHKQALDNAQRMIAASLANTSAEESGGVALPAAQHQFWRNTEAPPTPPRSDVSNEEDK